MTAPLNNLTQGTPFATGVDAFVYPQFLGEPRRAPTVNDIFNPGTRWQDNSVNPPVQYYTVGAGLWYELSNSSFGVSSVTGTANQITASPNVGAVVLSIPSAFIAPGSIASTTTITAGTGITATTGNIVASTGNITSTLGSISAATTVTAGTGITSTTGNIVASAGNINATLGSISAGTTVTAGTGITSTTGNITSATGNLIATVGNLNLNGVSSVININASTPASASVGTTAALTTGAIVVSTTAITANSLVFFATHTLGTVTVP